LEESVYDERGQPLSATLADYHVPGASSIPDVRIVHMETPSPFSEFGMKGVGESGAIGPPAAIANAVNDALRPLGAEILETPMTPKRVLAAIRAARERR
jgi:carbon-monoxide dehydrogenase large subunit